MCLGTTEQLLRPSGGLPGHAFRFDHQQHAVEQARQPTHPTLLGHRREVEDHQFEFVRQILDEPRKRWQIP